MLKPRNTLTAAAGLFIAAVLQAVIAPVGKAAFKAIFDVEVQDAWKDGAHPIIAAMWPKVAAMLEWLNTFWGGALFVLAVVFCAEVSSMRRRRLIQVRDEADRTASKEELAAIGRQCLQLSRTILREHTRAARARAETTARTIFGGQADMGFDNWLRNQADQVGLANEFSAEALAKIHILELLGLPIPDFTATEPVPYLKQPLAYVIQYHLVQIAQYLGAVAVPLQEGNLNAACSLSAQWITIAPTLASSDGLSSTQLSPNTEMKT